MKRTEKLFARLENLEDEYRKLIIREFERASRHLYSRYLIRKTASFLPGKYWRDSDTAYIERVEKEIIALRKKLHEPLSESPVAVVSEFVSKCEDIKDWRAEETHFAKQILAKLRQ
jgi:hypothetical protein